MRSSGAERSAIQARVRDWRSCVSSGTAWEVGSTSWRMSSMSMAEEGPRLGGEVGWVLEVPLSGHCGSDAGGQGLVGTRGRRRCVGAQVGLVVEVETRHRVRKVWWGCSTRRDAPSLVPRAADLLAPLSPVLPTSTTKTPRRLTRSWKIKSLNQTNDAIYFLSDMEFSSWYSLIRYLDTRCQNIRRTICLFPCIVLTLSRHDQIAHTGHPQAAGCRHGSPKPLHW